MPSWNKIEFEAVKAGTGEVPVPNDENLEMSDEFANMDWALLLDPSNERQGFLVQNTSQSELSIRISGSNVTGARLPGYGDSFSPDFRPEGGYEIKAAADNSSYVLTVW